MSQKALSNWLKFILIGVAVCGLVVYAAVIPSVGLSTVEQYPEFSCRFLPWLLFLSATAFPLYAVLVLCWKVACNIGKDRSFCVKNAGCFKWCAALTAIDTVFFFAGNVLYLFLDLSHPGVVLLSLMISFAGAAVSIVFAVLSRLTFKAAALQDESDHTI